MSKNRIILILVVLSALIVTVAVSAPFSKASISNPAGANDFYQRHPGWAQTGPNAKVILPVTGPEGTSDYHQRHPELNERAGAAADTSDYALRHPELNVGAGIVSDMSDYSSRHPELFQGNNATDTSDYFLRH